MRNCTRRALRPMESQGETREAVTTCRLPSRVGFQGLALGRCQTPDIERLPFASLRRNETKNSLHASMQGDGLKVGCSASRFFSEHFRTFSGETFTFGSQQSQGGAWTDPAAEALSGAGRFSVTSPADLTFLLHFRPKFWNCTTKRAYRRHDSPNFKKKGHFNAQR